MMHTYLFKLRRYPYNGDESDFEHKETAYTAEDALTQLRVNVQETATVRINKWSVEILEMTTIKDDAKI